MYAWRRWMVVDACFSANVSISFRACRLSIDDPWKYFCYCWILFGYCRWVTLYLFSCFIFFLLFFSVCVDSQLGPNTPRALRQGDASRNQGIGAVFLVFLSFLRVRGLPSPLNARKPPTSRHNHDSGEPADTRYFPASISRMMLNHSTYGLRGSYVSTAVDVRCTDIILHALCMRFEDLYVSS